MTSPATHNCQPLIISLDPDNSLRGVLPVTQGFYSDGAA